MTQSDFTSLEEFILWVSAFATDTFNFLVEQYGFTVIKNKVSRNHQSFSLEFQKDDMVVGVWIEFACRPEVFIAKDGKRTFTNCLLTKLADRTRLPVRNSVFGKRTLKADYTTMLTAYKSLVMSCLDERIVEQDESKKKRRSRKGLS